MCTLTYLPLENEQFIFTTNRDESPERAHASFPVNTHLENKNIIYPQDPKAGGTWFASTDNGTTACLLNGAFKAHEYKPPYRISRGKVMLEAMECIKPEEFFKNYHFEGIEPFTMVVLFHDPELKIVDFKWDGEKTHLQELAANEPHIWASAQLYTEEQIAARKALFKKWLQENKEFTQKEIFRFHETAGKEDPENSWVMDRGVVKTVSISSVHSKVGLLSMLHKDLINGKEQELILAQNVNQDFSNHIL